ncbi:acyltransferase [Lysobacter sp. K5869]|uniref:acyltransferase family protein n=1 Tax=Lysobacter sp. K5869 TaxID=2820808 RepID=UPI001C05FEAF|nr:acyltransferase [Lysobacter sp. K5869]QWP79095.1 acyltransferase [Lysobacter sp. K5869]
MHAKTERARECRAEGTASMTQNSFAASSADLPARDEKNLDFIQALRGAAALAVVLYHGSRFISPYGEGLGFRLFGAGGAMGVDLFFVISGFIMAYTTAGSDGSRAYALKFAIKRWSRVWPTYVLISLVYVVATWGWGWFPGHIEELLVTLTFVPITAIHPASIQYPALGVGWSLNYEMYFYAVFGASLLFGRWRWAAFAGWIALTLIALPLLAGAEPTLSTGSFYPSLPACLQLAASPLVWLFAGGVLIGRIYLSRWRPSEFWAPFLALSGLFAWAFQYSSGYRAEHGILSGGFSALLLVFGLALASKSIKIEAPKPLVWLGNISFSLYLLHPLAQERMEAIVRWSEQEYFDAGFPMLFLTTAVAILLAMLSHRYLERGLSDWVRDRLMAPREAVRVNA